MKTFQRASHDRLSATDGVYAVALTLLALEIVVPSVNSIHSSSQLNIYVLNNLLPQLSLYFISFIILSNFWASTNAIPMYKKVDNTIILTINLAILALVVLIPLFNFFFVLSFYQYSQSVIVFSLIILLAGLLYLILYIYLFKEKFS